MRLSGVKWAKTSPPARCQIQLLLVFLITFSLAGCSTQASTTESISAPANTPLPAVESPSPEPASASAPPAAITQTPTSAAPPDQLPVDQLTHYRLDVIMDYVDHSISVQEFISYTNRSSVPLDEILLMVEPNVYPGVFKLSSLTWGLGRQEDDASLVPLDSFLLEGNFLTVQLPQPLKPGEGLQLGLEYSLYLPSPQPSPDLRPVPFGYTARQANLVDWYPYIPPFEQEKGWLAHPPSFYGEHQVYETSDFDVLLRFDPHRPDLVVAASAPDEGDASQHRFRLDSARNFAFSVSDQYLVSSQTVQGVTILSYALSFHQAAGEHALKTTVEAFTLFQDLLAPYPHQTLSVVEADFLDGMEYDGLYFLSNGFYNLYSGSQADYLTAIAAHETAHQWWYGLVGNDQALEPWLDEALCTYSEILFYETYYPEAIEWWWVYRIDYYAPAGWVDTTIYNPEASPTPYNSYRSAVYLNGAHFLSDLRTLIGDTAFFAFLRAYTSNHIAQITTAVDFFDTLALFSKEDLSALRSKYFKAP